MQGHEQRGQARLPVTFLQHLAVGTQIFKLALQRLTSFSNWIFQACCQQTCVFYSSAALRGGSVCLSDIPQHCWFQHRLVQQAEVVGASAALRGPARYQVH